MFQFPTGPKVGLPSRVLATLMVTALGTFTACSPPAPAPTVTPQATSTPPPTSTPQPSPSASPNIAAPLRSVASPAPVPPELRARLAGQAEVRRERFSLESVTAASTLGATAPITTTGQGVLVLPDQVQVRLGGPAYASVGEAEIVAQGDQLYLRLGQQWLEFDNSQAVASLLPIVNGNFAPERGLGGVSDVREVDREPVRGAATTVYAFALGATQLQQPNLPGAQGIAATWEQGDGRVWIGDDGVIRRLETRLTGRTAQGAPATARTTLDFFDFNDPTIAVSLPAGANPVAVARPSTAASPGAAPSPSPSLSPAVPPATATAGH